MDEIYEEMQPYGVKGYVILMSDQFGNPPTEQACKKYRKDHDLTLTMLYDPTGKSGIFGGMETSMVLTPDTTIHFKVVGKWWAGIKTAIEEVLEMGE